MGWSLVEGRGKDLEGAEGDADQQSGPKRAPAYATEALKVKWPFRAVLRWEQWPGVHTPKSKERVPRKGA